MPLYIDRMLPIVCHTAKLSIGWHEQGPAAYFDVSFSALSAGLGGPAAVHHHIANRHNLKVAT